MVGRYVARQGAQHDIQNGNLMLHARRDEGQKSLPAARSPALRRLRIQLAAGAVAAIAIVWGAIFYQLINSRDAALSSARREGDNLASMVTEYFSSYVATIDPSLRHLRSEWLRDPRNFAAAVAFENARLGGKSAVHQTAIIDQTGWMVFSDTGAPKPRIYLGDRAHFKIHAAAGATGDRLYISDPVRGRASGKLSIQFTRQLWSVRSCGFFGRGRFAK